MRGRYSSKGNPCPICADTHGCRIGEDDLIFCLRGASPQDAPKGFRFLKALANGMGGLFARGEQSEYDEQRQRQLTEQRQRREREKAQRRLKLLSTQERDKQFRLLLKWRLTGLNTTHQEHLRTKRQLTQAEIDLLIQQGWVRSWQSGTSAPHGVASDLPGITPDGKLADMKGFLIAALDPIKRITGAQLATLADPKYLWLSSASRGGNGPQLRNGELPLFCWQHPDAQTIREVWFTEGALKSLLTAVFLWRSGIKNVAVVGTAAGARYGPKTLSAYLQHFGTKEIRLLPDAGAIANKLVSQANRETATFIRSHGYSLQVGWWGQVTKDQQDIDELLAEGGLGRIQWLSFEQYAGEDAPQEREISRDDWEIKFGFGRQLKHRIKRALAGFKGFGQRKAEASPKQPADKTFLESQQRLHEWQRAVKLGYKYILDASAPGLGKSWAIGNALPALLDVEKLFYLASDHRNATTGAVEDNYTDLPVRHNGLKIDSSRKTQNGNPFIRWPKPKEETEIQGNCHRTELFAKFRAKNLAVEDSESSPICGTCKLRHLCKSGSGAQYGASFRGDRRDALTADRIRAHADSLPSPTSFEYSLAGLAWEEASGHFKVMQEVVATQSEIDRVWARLEAEDSCLFERLREIRLALNTVLSGEIKAPSRYGWDDAALRAVLPPAPDDWHELRELMSEALTPDYSFLEDSGDRINAKDAERAGLSKAQQESLNRQLKEQARDAFSRGFDNLPMNWLLPALDILWGGEPGALRSEWGKLSLFVPDERHRMVARAAKFNLFLDATLSKRQLAMLLDVSEEEIFVIKQETPSQDNLKIIQVTGLGKLGKERRDTQQQRAGLIKEALREKYPELVIGDWKVYAQTGDAQWFVSLRGSNEYQESPAIATFGVPYENLGHLQSLYKILTGHFPCLDGEPDPCFQRFVDERVQGEITQAIGRLRSHLRPNEQLTFIFVGDYDLSFLGQSIEQIPAFTLCEQAGTPRQKSRWAIWQAYQKLRGRSEDEISCTELATQTGISKGRISQIAREFGGWDGLNRCLGLLYKSLYNNSKQLANDEDTYWLAQNYLPEILTLPSLEALGEVAVLARSQGWKGLDQVLSATSTEIKSQLLSLFLNLVPDLVFELDTGGALC